MPESIIIAGFNDELSKGSSTKEITGEVYGTRSTDLAEMFTTRSQPLPFYDIGMEMDEITDQHLMCSETQRVTWKAISEAV